MDKSIYTSNMSFKQTSFHVSNKHVSTLHNIYKNEPIQANLYKDKTQNKKQWH